MEQEKKERKKKRNKQRNKERERKREEAWDSLIENEKSTDGIPAVLIGSAWADVPAKEHKSDNVTVCWDGDRESGRAFCVPGSEGCGSGWVTGSNQVPAQKGKNVQQQLKRWASGYDRTYSMRDYHGALRVGSHILRHQDIVGQLRDIQLGRQHCYSGDGYGDRLHAGNPGRTSFDAQGPDDAPPCALFDLPAGVDKSGWDYSHLVENPWRAHALGSIAFELVQCVP